MRAIEMGSQNQLKEILDDQAVLNITLYNFQRLNNTIIELKFIRIRFASIYSQVLFGYKLLPRIN